MLRYRDADGAFVLELGATYDPERAAAEHLLALDQAETRDDLEKWLRRSIKVIDQR
jgi:hypothetical protein